VGHRFRLWRQPQRRSARQLLAGDGDGADLVDHDLIIEALNDLHFDRGLDRSPAAYGLG